jgi:hypothetical protein
MNCRKVLENLSVYGLCSNLEIENCIPEVEYNDIKDIAGEI